MKDTYGRGKTQFFKWTPGRQGGGYRIAYLWNWLFDLVLIHYPTGSYIHWHTDPVPKGLKHFRLNIVLVKANGGDFYCRTVSLNPEGEDGTFWKVGRFVLFRPDIQPHRVSKIVSGERWVLSIGWTTGRADK